MLPLTNDYTWMDQFLIVALIIVSAITIETCIVFYLSVKQKPPPQRNSSEFFISIFKWKNIFLFFKNFIFCFYCRHLKFNKIQVEHGYDNHCNEYSVAQKSNQINKENASVFITVEKLIHNSETHSCESTLTDSNDVSKGSEMDTVAVNENLITWSRLCSAIDVFMQLFFGIGYFVVILYYIFSGLLMFK